MAGEAKTIMLNSGNDVSVGLVAGADAFLLQVLAEAPSKTGTTTLKVVTNTSGVPFVAVFIGGKHVGFLSRTDSQGLLPALATCDQQNAVAGARATLAASPDGTAPPTLKLSLASPDQLLTTPKPAASPPVVERPEMPPEPAQFCRGCGKRLPAGAKFCLECGTPVAVVPAPSQGAAAAAQPVPLTQSTQASSPMPPSPASPSPDREPRPAQFPKTPPKSRGWWGSRSRVEKGMIIAGAAVIVAVVGVLAGTLGGGDDEVAPIQSSTPTTVAETTTSTSVAVENPYDSLAKALVRNAATVFLAAYTELGTCAADPEYLSSVEPSIVFERADSHVVGPGVEPMAGVTALAREEAVLYYGDADSYSVITASRTGTLWGVYQDMGSDEKPVFYAVRDGVATPWDSTTSAASTPVEPTTTAEVTTSMSPQASEAQALYLGDVGEGYGCLICAVSVEDPTSPGLFYDPKPGKRLVAVEVILGNSSAEVLDVNPLYASLRDSEGFVYEPELAGRDDQIMTVALSPGEKVRGWIAFEVEEGASLVAITYAVEPFSSDVLEAGLASAPQGHTANTKALSVLPPLPDTGLGEVLERFGYSMSATSVEDPTTPGILYEARDGYRLIAVEVVLGNESADALSVNPLYSTLVDASGFVYEPVLAGRDDQLDTRDLRKGEKIRGWLAFEIPEDASPASIKYIVDMWSGDALQVGLGS